MECWSDGVLEWPKEQHDSAHGFNFDTLQK
jgi:hypothetical protein